MSPTEAQWNELIEHVHTCCQLLVAVNEKLGSQASGVSSVEVKTSARGVDTTVKAYTGSPVTEAGDAAMDEFLRVTQELTKRLMGDA